MSSSKRYITYVEMSLSGYIWTKPRCSRKRSYKSAENMVSSKMLKDIGIQPNFSDFSHILRTKYPEVVIASREYIGETREIELPEGINPGEFQSQFHFVKYNPISEDGNVDSELEGGSDESNIL